MCRKGLYGELEASSSWCSEKAKEGNEAEAQRQSSAGLLSLQLFPQPFVYDQDSGDCWCHRNIGEQVKWATLDEKCQRTIRKVTALQTASLSHGSGWQEVTAKCPSSPPNTCGKEKKRSQTRTVSALVWLEFILASVQQCVLCKFSS